MLDNSGQVNRQTINICNDAPNRRRRGVLVLALPGGHTAGGITGVALASGGGGGSRCGPVIAGIGIGRAGNGVAGINNGAVHIAGSVGDRAGFIAFIVQQKQAGAIVGSKSCIFLRSAKLSVVVRPMPKAMVRAMTEVFRRMMFPFSATCCV